MKKILVFVFAFSFLIFLQVQNVFAVTILSSNSTGNEQNTFYTNETVYVYADNNITNNNTNIRIYVVKDSGTPSDGSELVGLFGYKAATTNTSGHISVIQLLTPGAAADNYDIIIDIGDEGRFNSSKDHIDSPSTIGFTIKNVPTPSIAFSVAGNTSASHTTNYGDNNNSMMLQMKIQTGEVEDITLTSIEVRGFGTGNDKDGVSLVSVYTDVDADGKIGLDDKLIGFEKFATDDGIINIGINQIIPLNTTKYYTITYKMSNKTSNGQTYYFEVTSAKVSAASARAVKSSGFVLKSATKTISGSPPAVVCSSYTDSSSCGAQTSCSWCVAESKCKNSGEACSTSSCTGTPTVSFVQGVASVTADISGLSSCDGKKIYLRDGSCSGQTLNSCSVSGSGCSLSFAKPEASKNYTVCIDKNENNVFEFSEQSWKIFAPSPVETQAQQQSPGLSITSLSANWIYIAIGLVVAIVVIAVLYFLFTPGKSSSQVQSPQPTQ